MVKLERRVDGLATGPQLGYSTIEDGKIEERDAEGNLVSIIGKQYDGTHGAVVVSGPVPPRPSAPLTTGGNALLSYGWDGNFADADTGETDITIPAPMDFGRVEAHASKLQGFSADSTGTLLDTLESPRGGSRTVMLEPGTWFVKLVTRSLSGKRSAESLEVSVEVLEPVGSDVNVDALRDEFRAVDAEMNAAIRANKEAQTTLAGTVSTLQNTTLPALSQDLSSAQGRLDTARTELDRLTGVAPLPTVYAQHIATATSAFQKADIGNLTVTGDSALNTLTAQRIAANVASFLSITTDQLLAGRAQLGEAVARKFAAETGAFIKLYANQVFIGQGGNFLYDPQFLDAELNNIRRSFSTGVWELVPGTASAANSMRTTTATTNNVFHFFRLGTPNANRTAELIPVTPGQVYDLSVDVTTNVNAVLRWNLYIQRSDGTVSYSGMTSNAAATGRREVKLTYTVPDGVTGLFPTVACLTSGVVWTVHGNATFREKVTPALVVDGLIDGQTIRGVDIRGGSVTQEGQGYSTRLYTHPYRGGVVEFRGPSTVSPGYLSMNDTGAMDIKLPMSNANEGALWFKAGYDESIFNPMTFFARRGAGESSLALDGAIAARREVHTSSVDYSADSIALVARSKSRTGYTSPNPDTNDLQFSGRGRIRGTSDIEITAPNGITVNGQPLLTQISEYTVSGSKGHFAAADQDIATPTRVAGRSNATLASVGAGFLTVLTAGIYAVDYHLAVPEPVGGRTFIEISDASGAAYNRTTISPGEDQTSAAVSGRMYSAGERIRFRFLHSTGKTLNYTATIRLTKHS